MSSLRVAAINNPSASSGGLAISASGNVTGAGLDLITTQSFSAVSSVSINNCFSGDYDNYRVLVTGVGSSSGINIFMRVRASATDLAASYWMANLGLDFNGSSANSNYANSSEGFYIGKVNTDTRGASAIDVFRPFLSANTTCVGSAYSASSADAINTFMGLANTSTSYDGFTLRTSTGTFTGAISVYGYKK